MFQKNILMQTLKLIRRQKMAEKLTLQDYYKYNKSDVMHKGDRCRVITINVICASNCTESMYLNPIGKSYYIPLAIVSDCKLILRHISQLTDEEKKHIAKKYLIDGLYSERTFKQIEGLLLYTWSNKRVELINYLREKNIMIEPEDWFKSGKAVKE